MVGIMTVTTAAITAIIDGQRLFPPPGTAFHPAVKSKGIVTAGMPFTPLPKAGYLSGLCREAILGAII